MRPAVADVSYLIRLSVRFARRVPASPGPSAARARHPYGAAAGPLSCAAPRGGQARP